MVCETTGENGRTHQKTPGAELYEEGKANVITDMPLFSGKVFHFKNTCVAGCVDGSRLTCRGHPVCVGSGEDEARSLAVTLLLILCCCASRLSQLPQ